MGMTFNMQLLLLIDLKHNSAKVSRLKFLKDLKTDNFNSLFLLFLFNILFILF